MFCGAGSRLRFRSRAGELLSTRVVRTIVHVYTCTIMVLEYSYSARKTRNALSLLKSYCNTSSSNTKASLVPSRVDSHGGTRDVTCAALTSAPRLLMARAWGAFARFVSWRFFAAVAKQRSVDDAPSRPYELACLWSRHGLCSYSAPPTQPLASTPSVERWNCGCLSTLMCERSLTVV